MIGNDRLYSAVQALILGEGDLRSRVAVAMAICDALGDFDFQKQPGLREKIEKLRAQLSKGALRTSPAASSIYALSAKNRRNRTYKKYAKQIYNMWVESCGINQGLER